MEYIDTSKIKNPYVFLGLQDRIRPLTKIDLAQKVIKEVSDYYGMPSDCIHFVTRRQKFVKIRHMIMFLCSQLTTMTLMEIASLFPEQNYDHTTIMHGRESIRHRIKHEPQIEQDFNNLRKRLNCNAILS